MWWEMHSSMESEYGGVASVETGEAAAADEEDDGGKKLGEEKDKHEEVGHECGGVELCSSGTTQNLLLPSFRSSIGSRPFK